MRVGFSALVCTLLLVTLGGPARADGEFLILEVAPTFRPPIDTRAVDAVAAQLGGQALHGEALRTAILATVSAPGTTASEASFEQLQRLVEEGMQDFYANRFPQAIERLTRAGQALQEAIDLVGHEEAAAAALFESQMILAVLLRRDHREDAAREVVLQVIRTFPDRRPMLAQFSPEVVRFFDETRARLEQSPKAELSLATAPVHCAVLLNGQPVGVSPLSRKRLYPGTYALQLRCAGRPTRVRQVHLAAGPVSLRFDVEADLALRTDPVPWIVAGPHAHRAAAELGRQLSAVTVTLVSRDDARLGVETIRSEDGRLVARGTGPDARAAVRALLAASRAEPAAPEPGGSSGPSWASDWAAWATLGVGLVATGVGLALAQGARDDADAALDQASSVSRNARADDARAAGVPAALLVTGGGGLSLGGLAALAVPASNRRGVMHGPVFWALAGLGLVAASVGAGALLLDECAWQDHGLCPAVYGERLGSAGPAPALLLGGGVVLLGTAIVLRLLE